MFFKKKEISNVRKKAGEDGINEEEKQKEEAEESAEEGSRNACVEFAFEQSGRDGERRKEKEKEIGQERSDSEGDRRRETK